MSDRPANNVAIFITIIVKAPIMQIFSMLLAFGILALEYPAPFLKGTGMHRSFVLRVVLLLQQAIMAIMYYQVRSDAPCPFHHVLTQTYCGRAQTALYGLSLPS